MKQLPFPLLFLLFLVSACGSDDEEVFTPDEPMIRIVNNTDFNLVDVELDEAVTFGSIAAGATTDYQPHPNGDACGFSLTASTDMNSCAGAGQVCLVADPMEDGATYTLTLSPPLSVPASCDELPAELVRD